MKRVWSLVTVIAFVGLFSFVEGCAKKNSDGRRSSILASVNGGLSWKKVGGDFRDGFLHDVCADEQGAIAVGQDSVLVVSPLRWRKLSRQGIDKWMFAVWCEAEDVIMGGEQGILVTSQDRGRKRSMLRLGVDSKSWIKSIRRIGPSVVAVGDYGILLRSEDAGRTWTKNKAGPVSIYKHHYVFNDVWGPSADDMLLIGERQGGTEPSGPVMFRTTDFGKTLEPVPAGPMPMSYGYQLNALWSDGHGLVLAVGSTGAILRSTDRGMSFVTVVSGVTAILYGVWGDGKGTVLAVGNAGTVLRSTDNGKTFAKVDSGTSNDIHAIAGNSSGAIYVVTRYPSPPDMTRLVLFR